MENLSDDQSVIMEELDPQNITDEQKCNNLKSIDKQIKIYTARKDYIKNMLNIEKSIPGPTNETSQLLEAEAAGLDDKIKALEVNENKLDVKDFKIPRKTAKSNTVPKENIKITSTKNKFAALNTANDDVEDVTPAAPKVKPVMMKLFPEYNLIHQDIHRTHPTATNTHIEVILRFKQNLLTIIEKSLNSSLISKFSTTLLTPSPAFRPLKLVIKGLLASTDPEDIKGLAQLRLSFDALINKIKASKLKSRATAPI
ncbi:uncharacterized protein TNCV_224971 [Trichonephila clavipes]|nr:uncharacterized protein TNCV_224971 [Trichonephila clavipes]